MITVSIHSKKYQEVKKLNVLWAVENVESQSKKYYYDYLLILIIG